MIPFINIDLAAMERAAKSFTDGKPTDIYRVEASKLFNVPEDQVTDAQRRFAKQAAYLSIYGKVS